MPCLFVSTVPLRFISLSVMLLQEVLCALDLGSDMKKKKRKKKEKTESPLKQITIIYISIREI